MAIIVLVTKPENRTKWQAFAEVLTRSFDSYEIRLIELSGDVMLSKVLPELNPLIVLVDPELGIVYQHLAETMPDVAIIRLTEHDLAEVGQVDGAGIDPASPVPYLASRIHDLFKEEEKEPTRGVFGGAGEEVPVSRSADDDEVGTEVLMSDIVDEDSMTLMPPEPEPESETPRQKQQPQQSTPPPAAPAPQAPSPGAAVTQAAQVPDMATQLANPMFTAFYPSTVAPNQSYALMAFAHIGSAMMEVAKIAQNYVQMMGGRQSSGSAASTVEVARGTPLTIVPQISGIRFTPAEQVINWAGDPHYSATFLFQTPATLSENLSGRVLVFNGPLILGEIPVLMQAAQGATDTALDKGAELKRIEPVFASYSHKDTPVMEYFKRARENLGQKMLVDVYDLRAGEHWAQRLLDMINESAVFQLFWSKHSAESPYCRQEWEHALQFLPQRERFIQPVWWAEPMPKPPPELESLHFQRVELPTATRWKIRVGNLFGRG